MNRFHGCTCPFPPVCFQSTRSSRFPTIVCTIGGDGSVQKHREPLPDGVQHLPHAPHHSASHRGHVLRALDASCGPTNRTSACVHWAHGENLKCGARLMRANLCHRRTSSGANTRSTMVPHGATSLPSAHGDGPVTRTCPTTHASDWRWFLQQRTQHASATSSDEADPRMVVSGGTRDVEEMGLSVRTQSDVRRACCATGPARPQDAQSRLGGIIECSLRSDSCGSYRIS